MAKNTKQIALIQHRRGKLSELPTQLNEAEFGFSTDTNELFIGNPSNPALAERIKSNTFPYGNVQILTEFSENLKKITYTYKSNTDVIAKLPIVITGNVSQPVVAANTSLIINGTEIRFNETTALSGIVEKINSVDDLSVKAFVHNNTFIGFITTDTVITLEDGITYNKGIIERLGFGTDSFYTETSSLPPERTLQSVLDDYCSVKNYGAFGDGVSDDSSAIYNAIISLNKAGDNPRYYRTLFFPAGVYNVSSNAIPLPYGTHLKGEGIQRTVIKSVNYLNAIMVTMDSNMNLGTAIEYGLNAKLPEYITVEDLTIDVSNNMASSLLLLATCHNVTFRNVEFIGRDITDLVRISDNLNAKKSTHIVFEDCIFNTGEYAIESYNDIEHLVVKNCLFKNIKNEAIYLIPDNEFKIVNCLFDGNIFTNCSNLSDRVIMLGENTEYVSVVNSKFDEEITNFVSSIKPYETLSNLNYTDTLDATTNSKKLLQFKFTQPIWEFIDYLMNPNGEYLVKAHYNTTNINGVETVKPLTNGIIIEQGDETNNDTVTISGSNPIKDINISAGSYGNIHLGNNIAVTEYSDWEYDYQYKIGDKIQQKNENDIEIYECIKNHTSNDDILPSNQEYWTSLGTFNPSVVYDKPIDLNENYISDNSGNITFKLTNENIIAIDDSNSITSYSERAASNPNALANVEYVNTIAQTTVREIVNYDLIAETPTNSKELIYFDPKTYGDFVNMNRISINVRRPYYPLIENINENTLEWKSGLKYYSGDVVKVPLEDVLTTQFNLYISENNAGSLSWVEYPYNSILKPTEDNLDGDGEPLPSYGTNGDYAVVIGSEDEDYQKFLYTKIDNDWYEVGSTYWSNLFGSYAIGKPNTNNIANSIISIDGREIVLDGTTVDEAVDAINAVFTDGSVVASNYEGALKLEKVKGKLNYDDVQYGAFEEFGFPLNEETNLFECVQPKLIKTTNSIQPNNDILNNIWMKVEAKNYYYACVQDNIASDSFEEDAGMTGQVIKWIEVFKQGKNPTTDEVIDLPDVKYVSIVASNNVDASRLLFLKNVIDVSKRDINSVYEKDWEIDTEYNVGDRVAFKNRYYECLKNHISSSMYDLNTEELWIAVAEQGYDYRFDFERNIYKINENGEIVLDDDFTIEYNFSGYTFYLEFYDKNGNIIPMFKVLDDPTKTDDMIQLSPSGYLSITINYVRGGN